MQSIFSAARRAIAVMLIACSATLCPADDGNPAGAPVAFSLPTDGPLPKTYRVTIAVTDAKNPDWIIGTVVAGEPYTVTEANGGKFAAYWDGLDDNHMPMPPGDYGLKGIYMPAEKWKITGKYQTLIPQYKLGISSWLPDQHNDDKPPLVRGHGMWTWSDIAATPEGKAVFLHTYMENGRNPILLDLTKPIGYDQVYKSYIGGTGIHAATDGELTWIEKFIIGRPDGAFGAETVGRNRNVVDPPGMVKDMAALRVGERSLLYTIQRHAMRAKNRHLRVETDEPVNKLVVYRGEKAKVLAELAIRRPLALSVVPEQSAVYVLHEPTDGAWAVSRCATDEAGLPKEPWTKVVDLDTPAEPSDMTVDHDGRIYIAYPSINQVIAYTESGQELKRFGRAPAQTPGEYDPRVFMRPSKLTRWRTPAGEARILVLELAGPNRISEWTSDGEFVRHWIGEQIEAVSGSVAVDPENPSHVYVRSNASEQKSVIRFVVDYESGQWRIDAVWPGVGRGDTFPGGGGKFEILRAGGQTFMAFSRAKYAPHGIFIYRLDGKRWVPSASIMPKGGVNAEGGRPKPGESFWWSDTNGDGMAQPEEYQDRPAQLPTALRWHGEDFLDDLSLTLIERAPGERVWRIKPRSFDNHGNPVYHGDDWNVLLHDPMWRKKQKGEAAAGYGGNEVGHAGLTWDFIDGNDQIGYWWKQTGKHNFSSNHHGQIKIAYFAPDGEGGFELKWKSGRADLGLGNNDAMHGAMHIYQPLHGLIGVQDASLASYHVFTEDGLFVDRIFPQTGVGAGRQAQGMYAQPGEHFHNGFHYHDPKSDQTIISIGKYTPHFFAVPNWKPGIVKRLDRLQKRVTIRGNQIALPPEKAIILRGGAGKTRLARFYPAGGGVALDGSMDGWHDAKPVVFEKGRDQTVEVRCKYDPDHLYVRIHARPGRAFKPVPLGQPQGLFTHDRNADTVSFYFQGDPAAPPAKSRDGRPGDARIVFGIFESDGKAKPVALGMYPQFRGENATPATYSSPVGTVSFEHVGLLDTATLGHRIDEDGKGYVITASIPRGALPRMSDRPFTGDLRTMINFDATFGHSKFWWSNATGKASTETYDEPSEAALYPNSWAPAEFVALDGKRLVRNWLVCGPFLNPDAEILQGRLIDHEHKLAAMKYQRAHRYPPDERPIDFTAVYEHRMPQHKGDPQTVRARWEPRRVPDDKPALRLTWAPCVMYAACWIHVPEDTKLPARALTNPQAFPRFELNGEWIETPTAADSGMRYFQAWPLELELKKGWNRFLWRGASSGYTTHIGLELSPPDELLWKLRITADPPGAAEKR